MADDTAQTPLAELGFNETGVYGGKIIRAVVDYSDDSSAIVSVAVLQDMARRCALNAELLAALKATGMHLCVCEVFPAGSDLQCHVGEPSTFCVPCQTRTAIARAESQQ